MTVSEVVQHHEGDGRPRVVNLASSGYSYGIYDNGRWGWWRQPDDPRGAGFHDFATAGRNGKVMSVVLTGNRNVFPVTADDHRAMREIAAHAREHQFLVAAPSVFAHRQMPPPNATQCAGSHVGPAIPSKSLAGDNVAWVQIVACYHKEVPPPMPKVTPQLWPPIDDVVALDSFGPGREFVVGVTVDGHVFCPNGGYAGGPYDDQTGQPRPFWVLPDGSVRNAAGVAGLDHGYTLVSTDGEPYTFPYKP